MNVLGISSHFHDAAAALVLDGELVAAAQEERFTRRKGDPSLPLQAAAFCLGQAGLEAAELDAVVFYEKPFRKFYRIVASSLANAPFGYLAFKGALHAWFEKKLWIKSEIAKGLGVAPSKVQFSDHHLSHAASVFLTHDLPSAATLVVDGVGEWTSTSIGRLRQTPGGLEYEVLESVDFPHSLGLLYSAITAFLGFKVNEGEYKVMGLAPYGVPEHADALRSLVQESETGGFRLDLRFFSHDRSVTKGWSERLEALIGPANSPHGTLSPVHDPAGFQRSANIAASLQLVLEEQLERLMLRARELSGERFLCYAGGVALNCVANGKLARKGLFERIYLHPASGDAGGAVGAALAYAASHGEWRAPREFSALLGQAVEPSLGELEALGADPGFELQRAADAEEFCEWVAEALAQDQIIGWMHGRAEWGPRALGARSILARTDSPGQQERLNRKIKHRENFRPFAPMVLDEHAHELFEGFTPERAMERQMLCTLQTRPEWRERLAAVTHVDGSARVQCLRPGDAPLVHQMLSAFHQKTGLPVLVNTSFNNAGEPIVNNLQDALNTTTLCGLDALAVFPYLIRPSAKGAAQESKESAPC